MYSSIIELPLKGQAGAIELDVIGTDKLKTTVGHIETEKNVDVVQQETSSVGSNQPKSKNGQGKSVEKVAQRMRSRYILDIDHAFKQNYILLSPFSRKSRKGVTHAKREITVQILLQCRFSFASFILVSQEQ